MPHRFKNALQGISTRSITQGSSAVVRPFLIRWRGTIYHDCTRYNSHETTVSGAPRERTLYDGHSPTSPFQRLALAGFSAVSALANPERADMVASLGEVTGRLALERLYRLMLADPEGRELLKSRPVINEHTVDLAALAELPDGTFGKAYSDFMSSNGFSPDSRSPVRFVDDPDLAYVMRRYREVHDMWHVLSGLPPTVEGELALKWFELVQTNLPVCALSAVVGPFTLSRKENAAECVNKNAEMSTRESRAERAKNGSREILREHYIPWAVRAGRKVRKPLLSVWYERRWTQSVETLRRELNFEVAPIRSAVTRR